MLGVRIEIEIGADGGRTELLQVPTQHGRHGGGRGQALESLALGGGKTHHRAEQQTQIVPVEILGLLHIGGTEQHAPQPLRQERFAWCHGPGQRSERVGKKQQPRVVAEHGGTGGGGPKRGSGLARRRGWRTGRGAA